MKKKFIIACLFVLSSLLGSMYVSYIQKATQFAQASSLKMMGYMWSDSAGWISLSCENLGTPGCNSYQVTLDSGSGDLNGSAWSPQYGWLSFDAGCPVGASGPCDPKLVGNDIVGWARFVGGNPTWDGWVAFSSLSYVGTPPAPPVAPYGLTVSGTNVTGNAWGSTGIGWLTLVGVSIGSPVAGTIHLKPHLTTTTLGSGTSGTAVTALPSLTVPATPATIGLTWYKDPGAPAYTTCTVSTTGGTSPNWVALTATPALQASFAAAIPDVTSTVNGNTTIQFNGAYPIDQTYTIDCIRTSDGVHEFATASVTPPTTTGACSVTASWNTVPTCGGSAPVITWNVTSGTVTGNNCLVLGAGAQPSSGTVTLGTPSNPGTTSYGVQCTPTTGPSCTATLSPASITCPSSPACDDAIDNDGDTLIDSDDPGCHTDGTLDPFTYDASDNDENNSGGTTTRQCNDGVDNDADGKIDFDVSTQVPPGSAPTDPGCTSSNDNSEKSGIIIEH